MVIVSRPSFVGSRRAVATGDRLTVGEDGITEEDLRALISNGKAHFATPVSSPDHRESPASNPDEGEDSGRAPAAATVAASRRDRSGKGGE
ncbi:MAG TPA: hypothetical protein VFI76_01945 [Terrimicrobiaceae bacterium]|nr:hypothetical protein [Terrimicrobiaceae bacterium]